MKNNKNYYGLTPLDVEAFMVNNFCNSESKSISSDFDEVCKLSLDLSDFEVDDKIELQILIPE